MQNSTTMNTKEKKQFTPYFWGSLASPIFNSCQAEMLPKRKDAHRKPPRVLGAELDG
jgi:hypothetical protein